MRALVPGRAKGEVIRLDEGLSFWGGFDPTTGGIIDQSHPQAGLKLTDKIVHMAYARGSSSSSSVLAEAMRLGTAPAAIVLGEPDSILVIGSLVANRLYGTVCPIYVGDPGELPEGVVELGDT